MMGALAKIDESSGYTREQIELLKSTVAKGATDLEFQLLLYQATKTGLDPLARQIHLVKRWNSQTQREEMAIQTGIDGYRVVANRTGELAGIDDAVFDTEALDHPNKATVTVYRIDKSGQPRAYTATARWSEYVGKKKDGTPNSFWSRMPYGQLGKCAEALALRKAFPADLSGVYTHEEMQQTDREANTDLSMEVMDRYGVKSAPNTLEAAQEVAANKLAEMHPKIIRTGSMTPNLYQQPYGTVTLEKTPKPTLSSLTDSLLQETRAKLDEGLVSPAQVKKLWSAAREQKHSEDGVRSIIRSVAGVEHTKDIPRSKFTSIMEVLQKQPSIESEPVESANEWKGSISAIDIFPDYVHVTLLREDKKRVLNAWCEADLFIAVSEAKRDSMVVEVLLERTESAGAHKARPVNKIVEFKALPF